MNSNFFEENILHDTANSREEIRHRQEKNDVWCLQNIRDAYKNGKISKESMRYLENLYSDTMQRYEKLFFKIYNFLERFTQTSEKFEFSVLDRNSGQPIKLPDSKTGRLSKTTSDKKYITPYTTVSFKLNDTNGNNVYFVLPPIKDVRRAIEKLSFGYNYDSAYRKEIQAAKEKNPKKQSRQLAKENQIKLPHERLKDVLRFSIVVPYYTGIKYWADLIQNNLEIEEGGIKDKFCDNNVEKHAKLTDNNFRNFVVPIKIDGCSVECQLKLKELYDGDVKTHSLYEEKRDVSRGFEEIKSNRIKHQRETAVKALNLKISTINDDAIDNYNLKVLKNVISMGLKRKNIGVEPLPDGTYAECAEFIEREFLMRPRKDFGLRIPSGSKMTPEMRSLLEKTFATYKPILQNKFGCAIQTQPASKTVPDKSGGRN